MSSSVLSQSAPIVPRNLGGRSKQAMTTTAATASKAKASTREVNDKTKRMPSSSSLTTFSTDKSTMKRDEGLQVSSPSAAALATTSASTTIKTRQLDDTKSNKPKESKKRKRSSPFRIKVGCVVAVRYRPGGNRISLVSSESGEVIKLSHTNGYTFSEVWTDPQQGRDEGLALIGRRIRCCFPKFVMSKVYDDGRKPTSRMVEGEIVSIVDYYSPNGQELSSTRQKKSHDMTVELLIDAERLQASPFLKQSEESIDPSKLSESSKRAYFNEQRIRGKDKVIVEVVLANCWKCPTEEKCSNNLIARWVIRKRVPSKLPSPSPGNDKVTKSTNKASSETNSEVLNAASATTEESGSTNSSTEKSKGIKNDVIDRNNQPSEPPKKKRKTNHIKDASATRYIGDGNDSIQQQEKNWRYQAGRYKNHLLFLERPIPTEYFEHLSYGFIGEVVKVQPAPAPTPFTSSPSTLALVTLKRMTLPEHTHFGRQLHHLPCDMYDDLDMTYSLIQGSATKDETLEQREILIQLPIEELVIVSKRLHRRSNPASVSQMEDDIDPNVPIISHAYSLISNSFVPLVKVKGFETENEDDKKYPWICHRCRRYVYRKKEPTESWWCCKPCVRALNRSKTLHNNDDLALRDVCDCKECHELKHSDRLGELETIVSRILSRKGGAKQQQQQQQQQQQRDGGSKSDIYDTESEAFRNTRFMLRSMKQIDFGLSIDFMDRVTTSAKPITRVKTLSPKKIKKLQLKAANEFLESKVGKRYGDEVGRVRDSTIEATIFRSTSSRLLPYDTTKRKFDLDAYEVYPWTCDSSSTTTTTDKPRNLRLASSEFVGKQENEEKTMNSRAARANQRRLMKDTAAYGVNLDLLIGREQQLRFDRSRIHAWGVFADEDIREGEMIIEYRGEIIGNAMAEKREKEYENAKIGSDYMFRIDSLSVCDATKQGNVARFINASCDPNCYTKIISIEGSKRIAIYAKQDITAGDELCYDYKFPLEYDETRRIPCHCGSRDCRGFMNWDKRYVIAAKKTSNGIVGQIKTKKAN